MKTLTTINVGGSSLKHDLLTEYISGVKSSFTNDSMEFGKLVHSFCFELEDFRDKIDAVSYNITTPIYDINNSIKFHAETVKISSSLYDEMIKISDACENAIDEIQKRTSNKELFSRLAELEHSANKPMVRSVFRDGIEYNVKYNLRGRIDLYLLSACETKVILIDVKTNTVKSGVKPRSLLSSAKNQLYHYAYLLHEKYPNIQSIDVGLIVLRLRDVVNNSNLKILHSCDIEMFDCDFSKEACKKAVGERIDKINEWFNDHLSKPYTERMEIYKSLLDKGGAYTLGNGANSEEVTGSDVTALLNDNIQLLKLTKTQGTKSAMTYPPEYDKRVLAIMSLYTSSTGYKIEALSESEMEKIKVCFYIAVARGYSLTNAKPDCYIFPLGKESFYVVYESYHFMERKYRDAGYDIDVYFTKESDFPVNIQLDTRSNQTTIVTNTPSELSRLNKDGCVDFDHAVCVVTHNRKQVKTFIYSYLEVNQRNSRKGSWVSHPYEMCRKTCIRKVVSQFGELANLIRPVDVCDAIWGKKEVIIDQETN